MTCDWKQIEEIQNLKVFPLVSGVTDMKLKRIYPLLQKEVAGVCETLSDYNIDIIIFGSALTMKCNAFSDLDICIRTPQTDIDLFYEIRKKISSCCEVSTDVIYYNTLEQNELIKQEIDLNGYKIKEMK